VATEIPKSTSDIGKIGTFLNQQVILVRLGPVILDSFKQTSILSKNNGTVILTQFNNTFHLSAKTYTL